MLTPQTLNGYFKSMLWIPETMHFRLVNNVVAVQRDKHSKKGYLYDTFIYTYIDLYDILLKHPCLIDKWKFFSSCRKNLTRSNPSLNQTRHCGILSRLLFNKWNSNSLRFNYKIFLSTEKKCKHQISIKISLIEKDIISLL